MEAKQAIEDLLLDLKKYGVVRQKKEELIGGVAKRSKAGWQWRDLKCKSFRKSGVSKPAGHAERKTVKAKRIWTSSQEMQKTAIVWLNGLMNPKLWRGGMQTVKCWRKGPMQRPENKNEGRKEQSPAGNADTTPTRTRADAYFSSAHHSVQFTHWSALFHCGHTALAQGKKESVSRISLHSFSSNCCETLLVVLLVASLLLLPHTLNVIDLWREVELHLCASDHWSGMSGCLANPTPHSGYEPNFYSYMNEEHTQINLPDSHRSFPRRDDATIISTTEDPEGFPHSGAPSSSKQTAASRVPTLLGSWGNSLWKTVAGPGVGWQSWWHPGNRCKFGQRICCFNYFQFTVKREWRSISKRCAFVEKQRKSLNGKWSWGKRISDVAFQETMQEFESQRLQLHQASRWADQAQRDKNKLVWNIGIQK